MCIVVQKDEEVEAFRKRFAGSQADRIERAEAAEAEKIAAQLKKTKVSGCNFVSPFVFIFAAS